LRLSGTHKFQVYADDDILGGSGCAIKKNTEALVDSSKKFGLDVNAVKVSTWSCLKIRMQDEVTE
jgi:hypothetical protein